MKIYTCGPNVQYWYDRSACGGRSWWTAAFDGHGDQVGEAICAHRKDDIEKAARQLATEYALEAMLKFFP